MRLAITGGTGLVGRFIVAGARAAGDQVTRLGRHGADVPFMLGERPDLEGFDALIHCAFQHEPGRYRGGEGDDPSGFIRDNLDGSVTLFEAAKSAGVGHVIFLSSRAVYGDYPPGTTLTEELPPRPDTLYGKVKWQAEQSLADLTTPDFITASLRATGIYGRGPMHKWENLFSDFLAGKPITPRRATEVHGDDLSAAIRLLLNTTQTGAFNVSDIVLDRHDLLAQLARLTGCPHPLPARATTHLSAMDCTRLHTLGWRPGGMDKLIASLPKMI